jgi:two-component system chemotaxis response regulator CheB
MEARAKVRSVSSRARRGRDGCPCPASRVDVLAIGVSTGGPGALMDLIPSFPADFPVPILIVQHMPPIFTGLLAQQLAAKARLPVAEGQRGTTINIDDSFEPVSPGGAVCFQRRSTGQR